MINFIYLLVYLIALFLGFDAVFITGDLLEALVSSFFFCALVIIQSMTKNDEKFKKR